MRIHTRAKSRQLRGLIRRNSASVASRSTITDIDQTGAIVRVNTYSQTHTVIGKRATVACRSIDLKVRATDRTSSTLKVFLLVEPKPKLQSIVYSRSRRLSNIQYNQSIALALSADCAWVSLTLTLTLFSISLTRLEEDEEEEVSIESNASHR